MLCHIIIVLYSLIQGKVLARDTIVHSGQLLYTDRGIHSIEETQGIRVHRNRGLWALDAQRGTNAAVMRVSILMLGKTMPPSA